MKTDKSNALKVKAAPLQELFQVILTLETELEAEQFFEDLCTPAEIQAMADRWQVVTLIKVGLSYRQIYEKTGVSVTTIGRVARCMMMGDGGYNLAYQRLQQGQSRSELR